MPRASLLDTLIPLEKCALQPYFSNRIQLAEVIEWILGHTGPADICISTFSTSEEFLRRLYRLKNRGHLRETSLFCDIRAIRKTVALSHFIKAVFSHVHLCENHSKVVLLSNDSHRVAIVTSQNQTRGDRFEAGVITTDPHTFYNLCLGFDAMAEKSISLDDINPRSDRPRG